MNPSWWHYDNLPSKAPYDWGDANRGLRPWDQIDFHIDLGCGRVPKARMGIDLRPSPGATDLAIDLNELIPPFDFEVPDTPEVKAIMERTWEMYHTYDPQHKGFDHGLPFPDNSIKSLITHHALEHIGVGFEALMEECYRVLEPGGIFRIVVPLFPSRAAFQEYDHKRVFMQGTFDGFCAVPDGAVYTDGFSEPYNTCRFRRVDEEMSPETAPEDAWGPDDIRETRVTLWKWNGDEPAPPDPKDYWPTP